MSHGHGFSPLVGRTPGGGADYPVAVQEILPPLPPLSAASGVTVGVVDTGIALDRDGKAHAWFADHVSYTADDIDALGVAHGTADEHGYLADADGHGTFVAGLILHAAPSAKLRMLGVLDKDALALTAELGAAEDAAVAAAVAELGADDSVQVINLSFGGGAFPEEPGGLREALKALPDRIAVVAAAGNHGVDENIWPARFDGVVSVGALDGQRLVPPGATPPLAGFSNRGDWVRAFTDGVQLLAPFVEFEEKAADATGVRPPQHFRGWARWSGTSFAAATVSGLIAQTAIELGVTGAVARDMVLAESRVITDGGGVWVRRSG